MFLVIFASLDKGQHISSRGGIPYNDFFVPGILAYGVIATTFVNLAISTAILRDEGVLKRMQGTPLPRWAYVAARILSTFAIMAAMTVVVLGLGAGVWGLHFRAGRAARPDPHPAARHRRVHDDRDRDHPLHPQRRVGAGRGQPVRPAADLHLQHLVPDRLAAHVLKTIAGVFPIKALAGGLQYVFDPRHGGAGLNGGDLRVLAIWTVVGVYLMLRFLRSPRARWPDAAWPAERRSVRRGR